MKNFFTMLVAVLAALASQAQVLPEFSTADNPVWYNVQFKSGGANLADQGSGANLKTAAVAASTDAQRWALIGDKDGFKMMSKTGRYVGYSGSRFTATTEANAATLQLAATDDYWEIQRQGVSGKSMNQWGGTGTGKELGEWTYGDPNNTLSFVVASTVLPTFSDSDNETWYFIQFQNGGFTIESQGVGKDVLVADVDMNDRQLWKLVGTKDDFTLVCKDGGTAYLNGNPGGGLLQPRNDKSTSFKLVESTNANYSFGFEIHLLNESTYPGLNMYRGAEIGHNVSTWSAGDAGNVVKFFTADAMTFNDYAVTGASTFTPESKHTLWYTQPATLTGAGDKWMEYSLPIGNGQLGASLFGGVDKDQLLINEKTLWTGSNGMSGNYTCYGNGIVYGAYQLFGNLYAENLNTNHGFSYSKTQPVLNYVRWLDLETALGGVTFTSPDGEVNFAREYFVSNPDNAVVAHYSADKQGEISLRFTFVSGKPGVSATTVYEDGKGRISGKLNTVSYALEFKVVANGGTVTTSGEGIEVQGADDVTVVLIGATDYDAYSKTYVSGTANLVANTTAAVDKAAARDYAELKADHIADFQHFMGRVSLDLGGQNTKATNVLVDEYTKADNSSATALMLEELYYYYGRYLSISSSRGVDLPNNLQGIWNQTSSPAWHADIHANINVQMNYWPCETGNLTEMHEKFTNYIWNEACNHGEWAYNAQQYASQKQTVGWTLFTENNIFGGGSTFMTNYVIANAWYCTHLWQHYRYTLDENYLATKALPAMLSCCEYWMERLVKASDGTYECPNEYSPEHGPGSQNATAHSQQLVADLFANTLAAIEILGEENVNFTASQIADLKNKYDKLDKGLATETYDGKWGTGSVASGANLLREWKYSAFSVGENGHRHMSHLMCLYPLTQLTPASEELFEAAINSMKLRGDASTGWSMGWKINLWARALNGDRAHTVLHTALRHSTSYGTNQAAGGIYYNLYDSHAPFQIDGNFGACSGIMEMLLQSHTDTLQLLPALPTVWKAGSITGLKAIGDYTVDINWAKGALTTATVKANHSGRAAINAAGLWGRKVCVNGTEVSYTAGGDDTIIVEVEAGDIITIDMSAESTVLEDTIAATTATVSNHQPYDLQGRPVPANAKGLCIIDGSKTIRK